MTSRLLRAALLLLVAGASLAVVRSGLETIDTSPMHRGSADEKIGGTRASAPASVPDLSELAETRDRPVFSPERRPPEAAPGEADAGDAPTGVALIGLMRTSGSTTLALLRVPGADNADWLAEGGNVGGYTVRDIASDRVVLDRGGRTIELKIRAKRAALDER